PQCRSQGDQPQALQRAEPARGGDAAQQVQGGGQGQGAQVEGAVSQLQGQAFTVEHLVGIQAELAHDGQCFGIGAEQNVLSVVDHLAQGARGNAAGTSSQGPGRFEYRYGMPL